MNDYICKNCNCKFESIEGVVVTHCPTCKKPNIEKLGKYSMFQIQSGMSVEGAKKLLDAIMQRENEEDFEEFDDEFENMEPLAPFMVIKINELATEVYSRVNEFTTEADFKKALELLKIQLLNMSNA